MISIERFTFESGIYEFKYNSSDYSTQFMCVGTDECTFWKSLLCSYNTLFQKLTLLVKGPYLRAVCVHFHYLPKSVHIPGIVTETCTTSFALVSSRNNGQVRYLVASRRCCVLDHVLTIKMHTVRSNHAFSFSPESDKFRRSTGILTILN